MNPLEMQSWKSTVLWAELTGRTDELSKLLAAKLAIALPKVESVLDQGDTMPPSFTLHDSEHARRVAERIAEIAGPDLTPNLGSYEIASLLLAAYLHDIGMTPPLAKVENTLAYVLSADPAALTKDEQEELQGWLDDQPEGVVPPLAEGPTTAAELRRGRGIVAGYVRFRHAEWSGEWIRENLADLDCDTYGGWVDDIVLLCESHQSNPDELKDAAFDPRFVGSPSSVLNLRYAACLLRIADVLEFDPERTPSILFVHRDVKKPSAIFWHKDHGLSFSLQEGRISIHATSPDAITQRAISLTVDQIDEQLLACRRLADETLMLGGPSLEVHHTWSLETNVHAKIAPRNKTYEYVEGTFRPDPLKVLELIGGLALYGSRLAAVRELLQNAFDAIRDQIARQRLRQKLPGEAGLYEALAATHQVSLTLRQEEDGVRLICEDTGCGMSRDIITSRFLVGGRAASRDSRELERECQAHGFSTGRTARFGIGVLSYFLIASSIEIRTRRSIEASDPDGTGWTFGIEGIEDFGELRRRSDAPVGTRVEMKLAPDVVGDAQEFADKLREYLASEIRRLPCPFRFEAEGLSAAPLIGSQGWLMRDDDTEDRLVTDLRDSRATRPAAIDLLSTADRQEEERRTEYWNGMREVARKALELRTRKGELPDGLGHYRVFLGSFTVCGEPSLTFVDAEHSDSGALRWKPLEGRHAFLPKGDTIMSWNGMVITGVEDDHKTLRSLTEPANAIVEIDWTSDRAGTLAVHRNSFALSEAALRAVGHVRAVTNELRKEFVQANLESAFAMVNCRIARTVPGKMIPLRWPDRRASDQNSISLSDLSFPVIPGAFRHVGGDLTWRDAPVMELVSLSLQSSHGEVPFWQGSRVGPSAIGILEDTAHPELVPIWEDFDPNRASFVPFLGYRCDFPSAWSDVAGVSLENVSMGGIEVWNAQHPIIQLLDTESWRWVRATFAEEVDPMPHADELLSQRGRVASWVAFSVRRRYQRWWAGLAEREPEFLARIWHVLFASEPTRPVIFRHEHYFEASTEVISPSGWQDHPDPEGGVNFLELLGEPGADWQLRPQSET